MAKWHLGTADIIEGGWYWRYYHYGWMQFQPWGVIFATKPELEEDSDSKYMWYYGPIKLPSPPLPRKLIGIKAISGEEDAMD
jgi:hypothetical protein